MVSKHKRSRSRPTREERSKAALEGVDLSQTDAKRVLQEIASDPTQTGTARVAAARALLQLEDANAKAVAECNLHTNDRAREEPAGGDGQTADERDAERINAAAVLALQRGRERLN